MASALLLRVSHRPSVRTRRSKSCSPSWSDKDAKVENGVIRRRQFFHTPAWLGTRTVLGHAFRDGHKNQDPVVPLFRTTT